jgi:hypothetical protein
MLDLISNERTFTVEQSKAGQAMVRIPLDGRQMVVLKRQV